ncbi:MAG: FtsQ-type POTRA domain-containing protein [bacterium]|nr:FtsQ-type POTRA domain-containing protein [bacterium]
MRSLTILSDTVNSSKGEGKKTCQDDDLANVNLISPKLPQSRGFGLLVASMLAMFLVGLSYGGYFERVRLLASDLVETYFLSAGIVLQEIHIKGQVNLRDEQIVAALGIRSGQSLFGFDATKAQKQLSILGQVKSARVMRMLPSKLLVEIKERMPLARWMHDGRIDLIDKDGVVLRTLSSLEQSDHPLVAGAGADKKASALIRILSTHRGLAQHMKLAERVGQYRWNLHAKSGALIKLPPVDLALGVARFVSLPDWQALLARKNLVVDLRQTSQAFINAQAATKTPVLSRF